MKHKEILLPYIRPWAGLGLLCSAAHPLILLCNDLLGFVPQPNRAGYYSLLDVLSAPSNEEYEEMLAWLGKNYKPQEFKREQVKFDNQKNDGKMLLLNLSLVIYTVLSE
ncbi:MAG: plasmid pRiA4b ORF-3 family protein [Methylococcaceae bacterium]|nr:plasmid pRiA4b ORF-3 family protein [Methylococcaceae bacterium]